MKCFVSSRHDRFYPLRYGNNGCRRTYLSSRDLQAHIAHRHSEKKDKADKRTDKAAEDNLRNVVNSISKASLASVVAAQCLCNPVLVCEGSMQVLQHGMGQPDHSKGQEVQEAKIE